MIFEKQISLMHSISINIITIVIHIIYIIVWYLLGVILGILTLVIVIFYNGYKQSPGGYICDNFLCLSEVFFDSA